MKNNYSKSEKEFLKKIGQNIKRKRMENDFSQEELAYEAKLDRTYISGIERGERNISLITLKKLAIALNVDLTQLINGKEK